LETGSGAYHTVPENIIKCLTKKLDSPIIVGGGIRTAKDLSRVFNAGANMVVIGSILEEKPELLKLFYDTTKSCQYPTTKP